MEQPFSFFKNPENSTERKNIQETIEKAVNTFAKEDIDMSALDTANLFFNHNSFQGNITENEHFLRITNRIAALQQQITDIDTYLKEVAGNGIIIANSDTINMKEKDIQKILVAIQQAELDRKETTEYNNREWEAFQSATEDLFAEISRNSITPEQELLIEQKRQAINAESIQLQQLIAEKKEISYDNYKDDGDISGPSTIGEVTQEQLN